MLVGFELRHAQEMVQHIELVSLGKLAQSRHLLGDEGNRLICPALSWFLAARASLHA
jgi:hypothetical protein